MAKASGSGVRMKAGSTSGRAASSKMTIAGKATTKTVKGAAPKIKGNNMKTSGTKRPSSKTAAARGTVKSIGVGSMMKRA